MVGRLDCVGHEVVAAGALKCELIGHVSDRLTVGEQRHRRVQQPLESGCVEIDAADGQLDSDAVGRPVQNERLCGAAAGAVEADEVGHELTLKKFGSNVCVCVHADRNRTKSQLKTGGW